MITVKNYSQRVERYDFILEAKQFWVGGSVIWKFSSSLNKDCLDPRHFFFLFPSVLITVIMFHWFRFCTS